VSLASALKTRDPAELPSRRDEDWRWTDLRGLLRAIPPASPSANGRAPVDHLFPDLPADEVLVRNGRASLDRYAVASGARTLRLRFISESEGTGHTARFAISVAPNASLILLESYETSTSGYAADAALTIELGEGARLERILIAEDAADAISVSTAEVKLAPGAHFAQTVLTFGAKRQRTETRVHHPGGGGILRLDGVYLLGGQSHADLTTVVTHEGQGGETSQLTKGVAGDQARAVFQGRIIVAEGADKTDARMRHAALLLSDRAEVDAKPELEIYADDVACAHGNTVGALDREALFYARARGIPEAAARAMLTIAFVGEVVERIEHTEAREAVRVWVEQKLGALGR
jgi:Fe-S cluster assembly protein SufD